MKTVQQLHVKWTNLDIFWQELISINISVKAIKPKAGIH